MGADDAADASDYRSMSFKVREANIFEPAEPIAVAAITDGERFAEINAPGGIYELQQFIIGLVNAAALADNLYFPVLQGYDRLYSQQGSGKARRF